MNPTSANQFTSPDNGPAPRRPLRSDFTRTTLDRAREAAARRSWFSRLMTVTNPTNPMNNALKPAAAVSLAIAGILIVGGGVVAAPAVTKFVTNTIHKFTATVGNDEQTGRQVVTIDAPGCYVDGQKYELRPGTNVTPAEVEQYLKAQCERGDINTFIYSLYPTHFMKPFALADMLSSSFDKHSLLPTEEGWNSFDATYSVKNGVPTLSVANSTGTVERALPTAVKLYSDEQAITTADLHAGDTLEVFAKPLNGEGIEGTDSHITDYIQHAELVAAIRLNQQYHGKDLGGSIMVLRDCEGNKGSLCPSGAPYAMADFKRQFEDAVHGPQNVTVNVSDTKGISGNVISIDGSTVVLEARGSYTHYTVTLPSLTFETMTGGKQVTLKTGDLLELYYAGTDSTTIGASNVMWAGIM